MRRSDTRLASVKLLRHSYLSDFRTEYNILAVQMKCYLYDTSVSYLVLFCGDLVFLNTKNYNQTPLSPTDINKVNTNTHPPQLLLFHR